MTIKEKRGPMWLRILEISAGLIVLILGVILWWPGLKYGLAFYAALAIALILLQIAYLIRTYAKGISAGRRPNLILSVLAILIAVCVLAALSFNSVYLSVYLLAIGLLFAGIASAAYGTASGKIVGVLAIFITFVVFSYPQINGILALFSNPRRFATPRFHIR